MGNPFDAEDLTQDVFLSAYKNLSRFDGTYEKAWLSKIAIRKCLDHLKAAGRRTIPTEDTYFEQLRDKSIIFITHHLLGVHHMDRVLFLENGSIKFDGKPASLLENNPTFKELYQLDLGNE